MNPIRDFIRDNWREILKLLLAGLLGGGLAVPMVQKDTATKEDVRECVKDAVSKEFQSQQAK